MLINRVPLGRTGMTVPAIGLGAAGLPGGAEPEADDAVSFAAMRAALDLGIDFFDTADRYGSGRNESLIGRFIKDVGRHRVIIATKYGSLPPGEDGIPGVDNSPAHIMAACDESLQRLGVDVIDLYYMHRRDPKVPIAESVGAMSRLVEAGKVRALGMSEVSARSLREACAVHPIAAIQSEYSLWHREVEDEVLPACQELAVTFVPFSPLGRAFLTGALTTSQFAATDLRSTLPRFQAEAMAHNIKLVERLKVFAETKGVSSAQIALAWLMAQGTATSPVVPIPGSKQRRNILENRRAAEVSLSPDDLAAVEAIFAPEAIMGARYSEIEAARAGL